MVKIVGIGGSLRSSSYSQQALEIVGERVEAIGAEIEIVKFSPVKSKIITGTSKTEIIAPKFQKFLASSAD